MMTLIRIGSIEIDPSNLLVFIEFIVILITIYKIYKDRDVIKALKENTQITEISNSYFKISERDQLYQSLAETTYNARSYVHQLSVSNTGYEIIDEEEKQRSEKFLKAIETAKNINHVNDIKILGPKMTQKIGGLYNREKYGADVKVHPTIKLYDIRIHVVDDEAVVVGFSTRGEKCENAFMIYSSDLAKILNTEFMRLWNSAESMPLIDYIGEKISDNRCIMPREKFNELLEKQMNIPDKGSIENLLTSLTNSGYLRTLNGKILNVKKINKKIPSSNDPTPEEIKKICGEWGENLNDSDANLIVTLIKTEQSQ